MGKGIVLYWVHMGEYYACLLCLAVVALSWGECDMQANRDG